MRRDDKQIHRCNPGVIADERLPSLRWGFPVPCHVFGDRGLTNFDAELEEFTMDPGSAPQRVGEAHGADQLADFERHLRSAAAMSRLPLPEQAKTG